MNEGTFEYLDKRVGEQNAELLELAKRMVNCSPESNEIVKRHDKKRVWKEKERKGFDFNRNMAATLHARWDVVDDLTLKFQTEIIRMNDQIEDDREKYEENLIELILARTFNVGTGARIEQMAGLFMHLNVYKTGLEAKMKQFGKFEHFMQRCCDEQGYSQPAQLIFRYKALKDILHEQLEEIEGKQRAIQSLKTTQKGLLAAHKNVVLHNQMAILQEHLFDLQAKNAKLEKFIQSSIDAASEEQLTEYKIKNVIFHLYNMVMNHRGLECTESDPILQLSEIDLRMQNTISVAKFLQSRADKQARVRSKRRRARGHSFDDVAYRPRVRGARDSDSEYSIASSDFNASRAGETIGASDQNENLKGGLQGVASLFPDNVTSLPKVEEAGASSDHPTRQYRSRSKVLIPSNHQKFLPEISREGGKSRSQQGGSMPSDESEELNQTIKGSFQSQSSISVLEGWTDIPMRKTTPRKRQELLRLPSLTKDNRTQLNAPSNFSKGKESNFETMSANKRAQTILDLLLETEEEEINLPEIITQTKLPPLKDGLARQNYDRNLFRHPETSPNGIDKAATWSDLHLDLDYLADHPADRDEKIQAVQYSRSTKVEVPTNSKELKPKPAMRKEASSQGSCRDGKKLSRGVEIPKGDMRGPVEEMKSYRTSCDALSRRQIRENYLSILSKVKLRRSPLPQ